AQALGRLGRGAALAVPELIAALQDVKNDRFTRRYAALALGNAGGSDDETIKALAAVFGDGKALPELRVDVARVLGGMGKAALEAVPALVAGLKDPNRDVRREAAAALDQLETAAKPALPALRAALKDEDKGVRSVVAH